MEPKAAPFEKLRPPCVALSQASALFQSRQANAPDVERCLEKLLATLQDLEKSPSGLDRKLADYAFFPLSQVLGASQQLPLQALEICFECLSILIACGWREDISPGLSSQLVILLSLTADRTPGRRPGKEPSDDLCRTAFDCFTSLYTSLSSAQKAKAALIDTANVPSLGHSVTVLLEGVSTGRSTETQLAASQALVALVRCIEHRDVLASFLPGIVSTLSKVLTPKSNIRYQWKVLSLAIEILENSFERTVSDHATKDIRTSATSPVTSSSQQREGPRALDQAWLQASAGQLKLALANINRLHSHPREEVRASLSRLNMMILAQCSESLPNCRQLSLETALVLSDDDTQEEGKRRLLVLLRTDTRIAECLQLTFRDWTVSLGRIMQSADDGLKQRRLKQTLMAFRLLTECGSETLAPYRLLASAVFESVITLLQTRPAKGQTHQRVEAVMLQGLTVAKANANALPFTNPLAVYRSQQELLDIVRTQLRSFPQETVLAQIGDQMAASLRNSTGDSQLAAFWLLLTILEAPATASNEFAAFLVLDDAVDEQKLALAEELYSFALTVAEDDDASPQIKALALQAIALQARQSGLHFRNELIDALYPVLHHLGSEEAMVRNQAITCVNIISDSCGYTDAKELVVANVDYLVNAVALKLNAFDVSPQGPQVLLMMIRLAGPSLLPYLEDTVESIFAALEDYHGYPRLVELLFAVLMALAEEGVRAPQLTITSHDAETSQGEGGWKPTSVSHLAKVLTERQAKTREEDEPSTEGSHPQRPWAEAEKTDTGITELENEDQDPEPPSSLQEDKPDPPAPAMKTYALLLKVTQLTQHYLSSSSPALRTSLLSLIGTTIPALARHENSYLPLVNTLWPELVSRLQDEEPHIVSGSLDVIAIMSEHAGSFMRTRIQSLWPELKSVHNGLTRSLRAADGGKNKAKKQSDGLQLMPIDASKLVGYVDTSVKAVWQSLRRLLLVCVQHVGVDAEAFDEVLAMLRPLAALDKGTIDVLMRENADAVWLAKLKEAPRLLKPPQDTERRWNFVRVGA